MTLQPSETPPTIRQPEPSDRVKGFPCLMRLYNGFHASLAEVEKVALEAERLKEAYSSAPFYAKRAASRGPDYWVSLYELHQEW